ncbi:DUF4375 domain-containing protein [Marinobacterium sp. BA1]|uniref:DMP19 family protein n=1 Tax=Marinobacterium sp. BA1 TaxID=3138931 RepID=UPI0032E607DB
MILKQVTITKESMEDEDPYGVILSNIDIINDLLSNHVRHDEICIQSLKSYYVDYYLAQLNNGGFSQFVYNSNWNESMISLILDGLKDIGAVKNLKLFRKSAKIVSGMSKKNFERFLEGEYFGNFLQINHLNKFDDNFFTLQETENLLQLNSDWLKSLPSLKVVEQSEREAYIKKLISLVPDLEERSKAALEAEPRYKKIMRALCEAANQTLEHETAASHKEIDGQTTWAFHFITNEGHHHMIDFNGKGVMFKGHTEEVVVEIDANEEYGT